MLFATIKLMFFAVSLYVISCEVSAVPKGTPCPALNKLKYGRVRYRQRGRFVKFICNTGYIIAGEKYSTCHNGAWDSLMPKCVRASCIKVNPPMNGLIYPSHRGAVLNFFCKPGYDLRGPNATYCDGYTWDNNLPTCIETNSKPTLSCDFESENLCGWNHDLRHDFDWTRMNFRTPSGHLGTGPSYDHTKGDGETGYYMYIESSSRNENDTARLISPIYDKMSDTNVCLEFYYHMHGASTGQLRVYLKKETESWSLDPNKALFWKSGNHGDQWLRSLNFIGVIEEDFQVVIEGVRGTSYFSDIAVDDVSIIPNCTIDEDATTESDVTYTDDYQTMGSCLNRCDNDNLIISPSTFQFNCDCDETCLDNNTCCPDYIVICLLGPTDDATSTMTEEPTTEAETYETTTSDTTIKTTVISLVTTEKQVKKIPVGNVTSNEINLVLPKSKLNVTNIPQAKLPDVNFTNINKTILPIKRPTLVFLTPIPPAVIVQKLKPANVTTKQPVLPNKTQAVATTLFFKKPQATTLKLTTTPLKFPTSVIKRIKQTTTTSAPIDDVITLSEKPPDDEVAYFTSFVPITNSAPAPVKEGNVKVFFASSNMENQKIVEERSGSKVTFITIIIASVSLILLIVLSAVFLLKRYRVIGCRNRRKMYGSSSESQSDVRFLTGDEALDFNLACPDDDD